MIEAVEIALPRICTEEGFRAQPYNDADGKPVSCRPGGNLTWLYGLNLEGSGTPELGRLIVRWCLEHLFADLNKFDWFTLCNSPRQSVLLDIAFNTGVHGLLAFPSMLHYVAVGEWASAQRECMVKNPRLRTRYEALGQILFSGAA